MTESPHTRPFDLQFIDDHWGSSADEIYRCVLEVFAEETEARCVTARQALLRGERDVLLRVAHTLYGAAANVGALALAERAGALEESAETADWGHLSDLMQKVEIAWEAAKTEMARGGPGQNG